MIINAGQPTAGDAELVLKIGPDAKIFAEGDADGPPVVCIHAGNWQVLFYPFSWAEGDGPTQAEADRASDIVIAFSRWRNWIYGRVTAAEGGRRDKGRAGKCPPRGDG